METIDNTQQEMQQQLQQLRDQLNSQQIISDRLLRQVIKQSERRLKRNFYSPMFIGIFGLLITPMLSYAIGLSTPVVIAYGVFMVIAIIVVIVLGQRIPDMGNNLVDTAQKMHKFRRIYANMWKYELLPTVIVILLILWEIRANIGMIISGIVGGLIGGLISWCIRRNVLTESDSIITQIEELQNE